MVSRYAWIDALRGIAILMVISVHTAHGLKGYESPLSAIYGYGGYGVQLFFVASAMTLCMSMQKNYGTENWISKYAIRRYFRIAPMYYSGILFYFFWSFIKNYINNGTIEPMPQYTAFNISLNFLFLHGFFPAAYNDVVPGGWSIAVEMMFYVIFPAIFKLYLKSKNRIILTTILIFSCLGMVSLVQINLHNTTANSDFLYFNFSNQIHVFIIGILGFYLLPVLSTFRTWKLIVGIITFWLVGNGLSDWHIFNSRFYALAFYASSFVGLAALISQIKFGSDNILVQIGQRSFSMYVIHFSFMNIIDYGFNNKLNLLSGNPTAKALFHLTVAITLTYLTSGITKRWIEDKFISMGTTLSGNLKKISKA